MMKKILNLFKLIVYALAFPFMLCIFPLMIRYFNCDEYFIDGYMKGYSDRKDDLDLDYHRHNIREHLQPEYLLFSALFFVAYSIGLAYFVFRYF